MEDELATRPLRYDLQIVQKDLEGRDKFVIMWYFAVL